MKKTQETITIFDVELDVEYGYSYGRPGDYYNPPEPPEVEILAITLDGHEVMDLLSCEVIKMIYDKIESPSKSEDDADEAEFRYELRRERELFKD